ncbi:hypothetical protein OROHE_016134 [Orobanche hederae]
MNPGSVISSSPSLTSYSDSRLAEIAARVVEEFGCEEFYGEFYFQREENKGFVERESADSVIREEDGGEDDLFEFDFMKRDSELPSPVSADEIFCNGQIRPVYPVSARDLFLERKGFENGSEEGNDVVRESDSEKGGPTVRLPLRELFTEERETTMTMAMASTTSSSSSSEADELEGVPADTYCMWRPKEEDSASTEGLCKKISSSTGSNSKRWKFKDLLHRSHSDGGKDRFVFLSRINSWRRKEVKTPLGVGKVKSATAPPRLYNRNSDEKRRSYLPYRQDLVGLFGSLA